MPQTENSKSGFTKPGFIKDTPELRFSEAFGKSVKEGIAWVRFQEAMDDDAEGTLEDLSDLFSVDLHPEYRGVVSSGVLTRRFAESFAGNLERNAKEKFFEYAKKRRANALRTVSKYSSTVISIGFHDPDAIHRGARTSMPFSALIFLLHHLGFDPLKPLRDSKVKSQFQRKLGRMIVKKTAEALKEGRRVVLKPYVERIAAEAVEFIQDFLFGSVMPSLKPGLEDKTMKARYVNSARGLADYAGRRGIEEPLYETGQLADNVTYKLSVPDGPINAMLEDLYERETKEAQEYKRIREAIVDERKAREKRLEARIKESRKWRKKLRDNWAEQSESGKRRKKLDELEKKLDKLNKERNNVVFGNKRLTKRETEKEVRRIDNEIARVEKQRSKISGGKKQKEAEAKSSTKAATAPKTGFDEKAISDFTEEFGRHKEERDAFKLRLKNGLRIDKADMQKEVAKRKTDLMFLLSYARDVVGSVKRGKDGKAELVYIEGKSSKDLPPFVRKGLVTAGDWILEAMSILSRFGRPV